MPTEQTGTKQQLRIGEKAGTQRSVPHEMNVQKRYGGKLDPKRNDKAHYKQGFVVGIFYREECA